MNVELPDLMVFSANWHQNDGILQGFECQLANDECLRAEGARKKKGLFECQLSGCVVFDVGRF